MEFDDNLPKPGDPLTLLMRQDLDPLSINELDDRVAGLEAEIARVKARKAAAIAHKSIADTLFRSP